jgi:hypothetical protein
VAARAGTLAPTPPASRPAIAPMTINLFTRIPFASSHAEPACVRRPHQDQSSWSASEITDYFSRA